MICHTTDVKTCQALPCMLYCVISVLCYVMIYCTMIYHIVLCNDILHYDILYCAVTIYCTMIHYIVFCYDT